MVDSIEARYSYSQLKETADFLKENIKGLVPKVAIICGSGLGPLADVIENPTEITYDRIPCFPRSTVIGHGGSLVFGCLSGVPVVVMKGRFHFYEGYPVWKVTMPCKIFKLLGCSFLIVTNAAGGVNQRYKVGDIMMIKDHVFLLGLSGNNPLRGPNENMFGRRVPSMTNCYDMDLRKHALKVVKQLGLEKKFHEGIYASVGGPNYESVAEMKMLNVFGIDAVGMSTVPEVLVARHCDLAVFAFSLITNEGILDYTSTKKPGHLEVLKAAKSMEGPLQEFVKEMVKFMGCKKPCNCGCC